MAGFWQYAFGAFPYPRNRGKGMLPMGEREREYWQRFLRTGQIRDYLHYRRLAGQEEPNPRRRIQDSSKYKQFY